MFGARRDTCTFRAGLLGDEVAVDDPAGAARRRGLDGMPMIDAPADVAAACRRGSDPPSLDALLAAAALHLLCVEQSGGTYGPVDFTDRELRQRFAAVRALRDTRLGLPDAIAVLERGGALSRRAEDGYDLCPVPVQVTVDELEQVRRAYEERRRHGKAEELDDRVWEQAWTTLGCGVGVRRWRDAAWRGGLRVRIGGPAPRRERGARRVGPLALPEIPPAGLEHSIGTPFPERGGIPGTALDVVDGRRAGRPLLISPLGVAALLNGRSSNLRSVPRTLRAGVLWGILADHADHRTGRVLLSIRRVDACLRRRLQIAESSDYRAQTRGLLKDLEHCGLLSVDGDGGCRHVVLHRPPLPGMARIEPWRKLSRRWIDALPPPGHPLLHEALQAADLTRTQVRRDWVTLLEQGRVHVTVSQPDDEHTEGVDRQGNPTIVWT